MTIILISQIIKKLQNHCDQSDRGEESWAGAESDCVGGF